MRTLLILLCILAAPCNAGDLHVWLYGTVSSSVEQSPTPVVEVQRVMRELNPQPNETFVDYGCGDARWLIEAASRYKCRAIGIELDPAQAARARQAVWSAGLADKVQIIEGDALKVDVNAQVGVVYLYPDVLVKLKPKLLKLNRFASYMHKVDGVTMTQTGDAWVWRKPIVVQYTQPTAVWGGQTYTGRVCTSPNCQMCNEIARQLWGR